MEDKAKEAGQDDPELTAVVTGLIGEDTIEYLKDEACFDAIKPYVLKASESEV